MCRDADDDVVLGTAIAGQCDAIVTGDKDLLDLGTTGVSISSHHAPSGASRATDGQGVDSHGRRLLGAPDHIDYRGVRRPPNVTLLVSTDPLLGEEPGLYKDLRE